jgi:hypothetical protein
MARPVPGAWPGGAGSSPRVGPPHKLTTTPEKIALRWLRDRPTEHGFPTELGSAPRLAQLIPQEFGVRLHPRYLNA